MHSPNLYNPSSSKLPYNLHIFLLNFITLWFFLTINFTFSVIYFFLSNSSNHPLLSKKIE